MIQRLLGRRHPPHRGPARRPAAAGIGGAYTPRADGYANATELTAGIRPIAPLRGQRRRLSADPSREPVDRPRHRRAEGQDRRRRDAGDQPVLLRHRRLPALHRPGARRPGSPSRSSPGIMPVTNFDGPEARWPAPCGTAMPGLAGQPVRRPGRRPRDPPADRRLGGRRDVRPAGRRKASPTSTSTP